MCIPSQNPFLQADYACASERPGVPEVCGDRLPSFTPGESEQADFAN